MRNIWTLFEHPDRDEVLKAPFYQYLWLLKTVRFRFIQGLARPTIYNLLKKKEFRWIQLDGGKYRISKKSFDDWLDNLEQ